MRAIITRTDDNGILGFTGTTNRILARHYKTERGVLHFAQDYAGDRAYRVQFFSGDTIYGEPYKTLTFAYCPRKIAGIPHGHYSANVGNEACPVCLDETARDAATSTVSGEPVRDTKPSTPFVRVGCGCVYLLTDTSADDATDWLGCLVEYCGGTDVEPMLRPVERLGDKVLYQNLTRETLTPISADHLTRLVARLADLTSKGHKFEIVQNAFKSIGE